MTEIRAVPPPIECVLTDLEKVMANRIKPGDLLAHEIAENSWTFQVSRVIDSVPSTERRGARYITSVAPDGAVLHHLPDSHKLIFRVRSRRAPALEAVFTRRP